MDTTFTQAKILKNCVESMHIETTLHQQDFFQNGLLSFKNKLLKKNFKGVVKSFQ